MALISWSNSLAVGVKTIDDQHKKLIDLINALNDAMQNGKGQDVLGRVLSELVNYTVYHFETEERLMAQHSYGESSAHKHEHKKFVEKVGHFKTQFDAGNAKVSVDIMYFLRDWLTNHIKKTDKLLGQELSKQGAN